MLSELWKAGRDSGSSPKTFTSPQASFFFFSFKYRSGTAGPIVLSNTGFSLLFALQEQYEFCYKVVQEYIDAFSDYANFK